MAFLFEHFFDFLFSHSLQSKVLAINLSRQNIWRSGITSINISHYFKKGEHVLGHLHQCTCHINEMKCFSTMQWDCVFKQRLKTDQKSVKSTLNPVEAQVVYALYWNLKNCVLYAKMSFKSTNFLNVGLPIYWRN